MEVQHVILYFKLQRRSNDVSTIITRTQIVKELLFQEYIAPTMTLSDIKQKSQC